MYLKIAFITLEHFKISTLMNKILKLKMYLKIAFITLEHFKISTLMTWSMGHSVAQHVSLSKEVLYISPFHVICV